MSPNSCTIPDRWVCTLNYTKNYHVHLLRKLIDDPPRGSAAVEIRWNKNLSIKINIHSWRFTIDRLPTKFNLDARGIDLDTIRCPICDEDIETSQILFLDCINAKSLLSMHGLFMVGYSRLPKGLGNLLN